MTYQEHQNLPSLPDVPMREDYTIEEREFFNGVKELLEAMCGRREDAPAIPQFQMGTYTGDAVEGRLIETNFRPRYVRVFVRPGESVAEHIFEKLDDPNQDIDWDDYSLLHEDSASYHTEKSTSGIIDINDEGFTVDGATSHPNANGITYDWLAFG